MRTSFLITPYQQDRGTIDVHDLVLVRNGDCEAGGVPSRAARIHEEIYRQHRGNRRHHQCLPGECHGVQCHRRAARQPHDSGKLHRDPRGQPLSLRPAVLRRGRAGHADVVAPPAALLENDGVLVTGGDILEAFDRLEVLESTAEAIINCHTVGTLAPMPEAVTRELDRVFLGE